MPDPDRSAELRRQRALIQEHLAWLDREIADAENAAAPSPLVTRRLGSPDTDVLDEDRSPGSIMAHGDTPEPTASALELEAKAEAVMAEARIGSADLERDVRRGCFLYFTAALVLLGATVAGLYFALRH